MRFTHGYDLLFKLGIIVGGIMVVSAGADLLGPISTPIERALRSSGWDWVWEIITWAYMIGGFFGALLLLGKTVLPYWLPTYLHVRFSLFTPITPDEAEHLGFVFDGSLGGIWYRLNSIRTIDPEFRREALFRFANKIAAEHGRRHPFAMPEDNVNQRRQQSQHSTDAGEQAERSGQAQSAEDAQVLVCLEILGLREMPPTFDFVKVAYRKKIREFHPDKFAGERPEVIQYAEETSKRLNAAYAYLERQFAEANA